MMARLMASDIAPPAAEDAPIIARIAKIGILPGQKFDIAKLSPDAQAALADVGKVASAKSSPSRRNPATAEWLARSGGGGAYGT